jgi:hypothetical protein
MTSSSADRTVVMQPCQTIPSIFKVTVATGGVRLHDPARTPRLIVNSKARLVIRSIGVSPPSLTLWRHVNGETDDTAGTGRPSIQ